MGKLTLTVKETAATLGISTDATYDALKRGDIPSIRVGGRLLVPVARLEALLAGAAKQEVAG